MTKFLNELEFKSEMATVIESIPELSGKQIYLVKIITNKVFDFLIGKGLIGYNKTYLHEVIREAVKNV